MKLLEKLKGFRKSARKASEASDLCVLIRRRLASFRGFLGRAENRKKVYVILAVFCLLAGFQAGKGLGEGQKYILSEKGGVSSLSRKSEKESASFPLTVEALKGKNSVKKNVTVVLEADGSVTVREKANPKNELKMAIQNAVRDAETAGTKEVHLPEVLPDGTRMKWEKKQDWSFLVILGFGPFIIAGLYAQEKKNKLKERKAREASILCAIPAFNDQMLLLLNCGLVFQDAFTSIAEGYEARGRKGYFYSIITEVLHITRESNRSLISALSETADRVKNQEFSRFTEAAVENQERGTDLTGLLKKESVKLWVSRKSEAEKNGKQAETRLAVPLALLLLALIVITAAPAVIQVENG